MNRSRDSHASETVTSAARGAPWHNGMLVAASKVAGGPTLRAGSRVEPGKLTVSLLSVPCTARSGVVGLASRASRA